MRVCMSETRCGSSVCFESECKRKGKRGRGRTSRGVMSGRESIFACTSLPAQCQSTIAIDSKKSVDNNVVAGCCASGPTLNRHTRTATKHRAGMHQPLTARPDQRAFFDEPWGRGRHAATPKGRICALYMNPACRGSC